MHVNGDMWIHRCGAADVFLSLGTRCSCGAYMSEYHNKVDPDPRTSGDPLVRWDVISDERLLAELRRRGKDVALDYEGMSPKYWKECSDDFQKRYEQSALDRDEWKHRAEAAEASKRLSDLASRRAKNAMQKEVGPSAVIFAQLEEERRAADRRNAERAQANELWGPSDEDLLCEDA